MTAERTTALPEADAAGLVYDTMSYDDLVRLVVKLAEDGQAMHERLRVLENRLAHVPVEQARMAI